MNRTQPPIKIVASPNSFLSVAVSEKQLAYDALGRMPESATLAEMSEELAILAALRAGEVDADAGRVVSHEEVVRQSLNWV